jgi:hypothetical protein
MGADVEPIETEDLPAPEEATTDVEVTAPDVDKTPVERPQSSDRKSRKAQRLDVEAALKAREEIQKTLEAERAERQRIDRELAEMRGRLTERERSTQTQDKHAQTRDKIAALRKQAKAHLFFSAQAKDPTQSEKEWEEHQRLMDEADDLRDSMRDESRWEKRRGEIQQTGVDPGLIQEKMYFAAKFPFLDGNRRVQALADAEFSELVQGGRPANRQTMEQAITSAAKTLGLGGQSQPTESQRARYGGVPAGEGAAGGNEPRKIRVGRQEDALAKAAMNVINPHLDSKAAVKEWARLMARNEDDE